MKIDMTIDVYDATRLIREGLQKYFQQTMPNIQVGNITVVTYNRELLKFSEDMLLEPARHRLQIERADMAWPESDPNETTN